MRDICINYFIIYFISYKINIFVATNINSEDYKYKYRSIMILGLISIKYFPIHIKKNSKLKILYWCNWFPKLCIEKKKKIYFTIFNKSRSNFILNFLTNQKKLDFFKPYFKPLNIKVNEHDNQKKKKNRKSKKWC
jgi:hypothetical protein